MKLEKRWQMPGNYKRNMLCFHTSMISVSVQYIFVDNRLLCFMFFVILEGNLHT